MKPEISVTVVRMDSLGAYKCPRCRMYTFCENYDNLCNRCVDVLVSEFPDHPSVAEILKVKEIQKENKDERL